MADDTLTTVVIFGASGDLTQRKLIPSLFNLFRKGRMPAQFRIVGHSKTAFSDEEFRAHLADGLKKFAGFEYKSEEWQSFATHVFYQQGGYDAAGRFREIGRHARSSRARRVQPLVLHGDSSGALHQHH